jgi:serine/threonine-protein kinase
MSRVFVACENALGRTVVLKVLAPELAQGLSAERFAREVRLAAALQHPNIVPLLTAGVAHWLPYYTMPYVRGESLRARLGHEPALSVAEVMSMLRDVARALAHAHAADVVHRDIKPENVLLSGGVAMVADFGIARAISASATGGSGITTGGVVLGTPGHMAPEQALADPSADHRVDLYSLGVLAWEALAGERLFGKRVAQALIAAHIAEPPPDITTRRSDVPAALGALVMRLLAKRPEDRPASAEEVLRLLDGERTPEAPAPPTRPAVMSPSRRGARLILAVVVALATLGAGLLWWRARGTSPNVNPDVVAIAPFHIAADPSLQYLREGMVDLLAAKVGGVGRLRAIDPRTTLVAWRRAAGSAELSNEDALRVAHAIGAGSLIVGSITGTQANLTLSATMLIGSGRRDSVSATFTGPADSLPTLVDRVVAELWSLGAGEATPRLAALTSTSLPALRAYLDGRAFYRRARTTEAMESFTRALQLDSSFTLAALGLVRTVGWGLQSPAAQARARALGGPILQRGRARLSPADVALAEASLGPRYPAPQTYPEWFAAAERLTNIAPDNAEGWLELGDVLYHGGGILGIDRADDQAANAFARSIALDSAFSPSFIHLGGLYDEAGDSAHYRQLFEIARRRDSNVTHGPFALRLALLEADSIRARSLRDEMNRWPYATLEAVVPSMLYGHRGLDYAQLALDLLQPRAASTEERTRLAHWALRVAIERGRPGEAAAHTTEWLAVPPLAREIALAAVFGDGDSAAGAVAARALEPVVAAALGTRVSPEHADRSGSSTSEDALTERVDPPFVLAQYRLAMGDVAVARRVIPWLRGYVPPNDSTWLAELTEERAVLLDAQVAALERRADANAVLVRLDSATQFGHHDLRFTTIAGRVAARLWEARGDRARALAALRRRTRAISTSQYESAWQREVGRLAALVGDREAAIRAYRLYLFRRPNPEPALAPEVAQVRAELQRLEQASAGR